jgi:WD40 repeat protein
MDASYRLVRKILLSTFVVLFLAGIVLCVVLLVKAPPATSPEIFLSDTSARLIISIAWSPDGKTLASVDGDGTLNLWSISGRKLLRTLSGHHGGSSSVAWNLNSKTLASAGWDGSLKIWDVESGRLLRVLRGHSDEITSIAWSPDTKTLAAGSLDSAVKLWKVGSWSNPRTLDLRNAFSLWNNATGMRHKIPLPGEEKSKLEQIFSVAWSPEGNVVAIGPTHRGV